MLDTSNILFMVIVLVTVPVIFYCSIRYIKLSEIFVDHIKTMHPDIWAGVKGNPYRISRILLWMFIIGVRPLPDEDCRPIVSRIRIYSVILLAAYTLLVISIGLGPASEKDFFTQNSMAADGRSFDCIELQQTQLRYDCTLKPQAKFLEISLGMNSKQAFNLLLKHATKAAWSVFSSTIIPRRYSRVQNKIRPDDWMTFEKSDRWMLRTFGPPCSGYRYIVISVSKARISAVDVKCSIMASPKKN